MGFAALESMTSNSKSTAVGHSAGKDATGQRNTLFGANAGLRVNAGQQNTFVGYNAGQTIETGSGNVIIGNAAGNTTGETRAKIIAG